GWGWVEALAQFHDVWVLTNADRRESLESCLAAHPLPHVHWIFQDIPPWLRPLTNREPNARIHYATWQWEAYQQALRLHREIGFDLVHHLTFVQYWTPSYLSLLPLPFVWGPLGGGESAPRSF